MKQNKSDRDRKGECSVCAAFERLLQQLDEGLEEKEKFQRVEGRFAAKAAFRLAGRLELKDSANGQNSELHFLSGAALGGVTDLLPDWVSDWLETLDNCGSHDIRW